MKNRAQPGKALDITDPKRRATSAYVKTLMSKYHSEYIAPLNTRLVLAETILEKNCTIRHDRVRFKDRQALQRYIRRLLRARDEEWRAWLDDSFECEAEDCMRRFMRLERRIAWLELPWWKRLFRARPEL